MHIPALTSYSDYRLTNVVSFCLFFSFRQEENLRSLQKKVSVLLKFAEKEDSVCGCLLTG